MIEVKEIKPEYTGAAQVEQLGDILERQGSNGLDLCRGWDMDYWTRDAEDGAGRQMAKRMTSEKTQRIYRELV